MHRARVGIVAALLGLFWTTAFAQSREVRGIAHWEGGRGNCGENQGVGGGGNGTGYIADFRINASYTLDGSNITFHFVGYNGKEFFGPLSGPIDGEGRFHAKARFEKNDEDYEFKGKLGTPGTFTRLAHYIGTGNTGPRCTATWTVSIQEGQTPTVPTGSSHPTTVSPPPSQAPATPGVSKKP